MSEFARIAIDAAQDYRCISALIDEMECAWDNPKVALSQTERFITLHKSFYEKIIQLTTEWWVPVDDEFVQDVAHESTILQQLIERIRWKERSLLERITGPSLTSLQDHYSDIVECLLDSYGIDPQTHEIFFVEDVES
jgi:hypothetical protein